MTFTTRLYKFHTVLNQHTNLCIPLPAVKWLSLNFFPHKRKVACHWRHKSSSAEENAACMLLIFMFITQIHACIHKTTYGPIASSLVTGGNILSNVWGRAEAICLPPGGCLYTLADFCLISLTVAGADCVRKRRLIGFGLSKGSIIMIRIGVSRYIGCQCDNITSD